MARLCGEDKKEVYFNISLFFQSSHIVIYTLPLHYRLTLFSDSLHGVLHAGKLTFAIGF